MFHSIEYLNVSSDTKDGKIIYMYQYRIFYTYIDGRRESTIINLPAPNNCTPAIITRLAAIMLACQEKRMSITKTLAEWFAQMHCSWAQTSNLVALMDHYFPHLQYNKKYERCALKLLGTLVAKK